MTDWVCALCEEENTHANAALPLVCRCEGRTYAHTICLRQRYYNLGAVALVCPFCSARYANATLGPLNFFRAPRSAVVAELLHVAVILSAVAIVWMWHGAYGVIFSAPYMLFVSGHVVFNGFSLLAMVRYETHFLCIYFLLFYLYQIYQDEFVAAVYHAPRRFLGSFVSIGVIRARGKKRSDRIK